MRCHRMRRLRVASVPKHPVAPTVAYCSRPLHEWWWWPAHPHGVQLSDEYPGPRPQSVVWAGRDHCGLDSESGRYRRRGRVWLCLRPAFLVGLAGSNWRAAQWPSGPVSVGSDRAEVAARLRAEADAAGAAAAAARIRAAADAEAEAADAEAEAADALAADAAAEAARLRAAAEIATAAADAAADARASAAAAAAEADARAEIERRRKTP